MGQVWCKNKNWKEQDTNKSPLDRVFLRCAQRIYPRFKDDGLNGATQRVSSSEIGYAGSPSTKELLRSRSISSVDRPFQQSDWVDVNLEVTTPKTGNKNKNNNNLTSTNRSLDLSLYQVKTPVPAYKNCKTPPVPPPRKKRRKKIRSLPALKINERASRNNIVKSKKDVEGKEKRREFYEHKVNGTGVIIPSKVVSGWKSAEGLSSHNQKLPEINNTFKVNNISTSSLPNYDQFKLSELSNAENCKDQLKLSGNKSLESLKYCKYQNSSGRKFTEKTSSRIPVMQNSENLKFLVKGTSSYPNRNSNKYQESRPERRNKENERNYYSLTGDFDKFKQRDVNYLFSPNEITTSRSHPFLNNESTKTDYNSEFRPKLILRRVHSDDNGSLDIMSRSEDFVTKSISEESLPSALMEDDDLNLFEDNTKDPVKNEITKIREELEAVTNEIKTPPRSPQLAKNSTKLRLPEVYADKENINSMTPSLSEFEVTLSELLENNSREGVDGKNLGDSNSDSELGQDNFKSQSQNVSLINIPAPPRRKRRKTLKSNSDDSGFDFYVDRLI
ncbi:uncharacterized protein LOC123266908 [Cotesia glomerata]|uniref:Uncharacterized protein n=1 Tax=Cotesia glomerata TaxID=32391 RepID=A0AAV7HY67_COTGL|nr:uncharacterized protein LOC123266908 [Cotesia glomerata]KAH0535411.1 hypothetical protein KQX54_016250 [Cotesia glomerata]